MNHEPINRSPRTSNSRFAKEAVMDERESYQRIQHHAATGGRQTAINRIVCEIADAESWERLAQYAGRREGNCRPVGNDAA
jgi:hypothetical protein